MIARILLDAYAVLRWRLPLLVVLICAASIIEGVGLTLLLPLLARFGLSGGAEPSALIIAVDGALEFLGVPNELGPLIGVMVGILVLQVGAAFAKSWFQIACTMRYTAVWREQLFDAVIAADWGYLMRSSASAQANSIVNESSRISAALGLALQLINAALFIAVYTLISLAAAWQMVAFLALFGMGIYLVTRPLNRSSQAIGGEVTTVSRQLMHHTQEFLANAKLIKSTATEPTATAVMRRAIEDYRRVYVLAGLLPAFVTFLYMALGYIVMGFGIWGAMSFATIGPGALIVSIYVFLRLYVQFSNFQSLHHGLALSLPALPAAARMLHDAHEAAERIGTGVCLARDGGAQVDITELHVEYAGHQALDAVEATLRAGEVIGVTGASGAGKSTFVDAVVGLVRPVHGGVSIDGVSMAELDIHDWRTQIGYVAQETLLIQGTVEQNIAWGVAEPCVKAVREAARLANAEGFIQSMPGGYQARIGGRGVRISGGQRQRIGLARALYGHKRLLILDEATSALDSESEEKVLGAIVGLRGRVTVIMVAHRLSTLRCADRVLVFEEGRITECGGFGELLDAGGTFARLWSMQAGPAGEAVEATL